MDASSTHYRLLWVDMKLSIPDYDTIDPFRDVFAIHEYAAISSLDGEIEKLRPAVICFDFDFPTKEQLKLLQRTKQDHAAIPMIMLTVQHSEALAVWAFRTRVWDYLVKPVPQRDLDRCLCALREILTMRNAGVERRRAVLPMSGVPDENRWGGPRGYSPVTLAPAIEYVERGYREKLTSTDAAALCKLSSFQFSRLFKETYGLSFLEYLLRFRIREACRLLKNPSIAVTDVAHLAGFQDPSYFSKIFRRYMDCAPSQFQTAHETALDPELLFADIMN